MSPKPLPVRDCRANQVQPVSDSSPGPYCIPVNHDSMDLSYTLAGFHKGDLDCDCQKKIETAKRSGFTSITLTPTFEFDTKSHKVLSGSLWPGEIKSCLERIWKSGLNIVFKPHLDSAQTLNSKSGQEEEWRASFKVGSQSNYEELFKEFFEWTQTHKNELSGGVQKVTVITMTELEQSLADSPQFWLNFTKNMKERLKQLSNSVKIGWAPNWIYGVAFPKKSLTKTTCSDYLKFTDENDFFAPSFYGDWSKTDQGITQAYYRESEVRYSLSNSNGFKTKLQTLAHELASENIEKNIFKPNHLFWSKRMYLGCTNDSLLRKPFAVGEFALGQNIARAELDTRASPVKINSDILIKRAQAYKNLLSWAKLPKNNSTINGLPLTIWTVTPEFDPTSHANIVQLFKDYSEERCKKPSPNLEMLKRFPKPATSR
ncbi:MAG: hypothetical protein AB7F59_12290 [Bdellovibrionales bacterium]